jgi:hypothetical protein
MHPTKYFSSINHSQIAVAETFPALSLIGLDVLENMPEGDIIQICGPISTGLHSVEENLAIFDKTIVSFFKSPLLVFNQIPFEKRLEYLKNKWEKKNPNKGYCTPILDEFYLPLLESGRIKTLVFLPGWRHSTGATWERDQAIRLGIKRVYLPKNWTGHYDIRQIPKFQKICA